MLRTFQFGLLGVMTIGVVSLNMLVLQQWHEQRTLVSAMMAASAQLSVVAHQAGLVSIQNDQTLEHLARIETLLGRWKAGDVLLGKPALLP